MHYHSENILMKSWEGKYIYLSEVVNILRLYSGIINRAGARTGEIALNKNPVQKLHCKFVQSVENIHV